MQFPVLAVLGIAFVILKLCAVITWPWIWVLAPFWVGLLIFLLIGGFALLILMSAGSAPKYRPGSTRRF